jgi:serine/threonine protein kinase
MKQLRSSKSKDVKARARMHREVTSLQTLAPQGARVPRYLDGNTAAFEQTEVPLFFVMEYIEGQTLDVFLKLNGPLSLEDSVAIALDLCATMKVAIKEGVSHRDIKPENLIVRSLQPADIFMLDFGLSFNREDETHLTDVNETLDNSFFSLPERECLSDS